MVRCSALSLKSASAYIQPLPQGLLCFQKGARGAGEETPGQVCQNTPRIIKFVT